MVVSVVSDRPEILVPAALREPGEAAALAGDYAAFIERHIAEAYRLATFILGDRSDAEDAVHEAAVSAWRHWSQRRDAERSEAWFRKIVVNAARDQLRARRRVRAVDIGLHLDPEWHPASDPIEARVGARDEVERALQSLDADSRTLLALRFGLDLSVPSIAASLGLREGTVKSRLHRALHAVRDSLEGHPR